MIAQTNSLQAMQRLSRQQLPYMFAVEGKHDETKARQVAQEFEALFIEQILKQADEAMDHEDNILYAGHAEDIVQGMYHQELARGMTHAGGFGVASLIEKELIADLRAATKEQ